MSNYWELIGQPQQAPQQLELFKECDYCGDYIRGGEEAASLYLGVIGPGPKSGQPMVIEGMNSFGQSATLHPWCIKPFVDTHVYDDAEDKEERLRYCASCEARLDPESDDG